MRAGAALMDTRDDHYAGPQVALGVCRERRREAPSLYAQLAQRVTGVEVLRILLAIGGTEICHFQTWHDKAGNAPPLTDVDPVTGSTVVFPDLNSPPFGWEDFQT